MCYRNKFEEHAMTMSTNSYLDIVVLGMNNMDEVIDIDVQRHGGNEWFYDDFPCAGPAYNELSEQDKRLVEGAITQRSVVVKDITYYIYCRNMASWWQMESPTASQELSDVVGINAPVNYTAALRRFYPLLTRVAFPVTRL